MMCFRGKINRPVLIHFFGADGVGKTTQAEMLVSYLRSKGMKTRLVRIRSGRTLASILYLFLKKIEPNLIDLGGDGRVIRLNMMRGRVSQQLWAFIELLSIIPWIMRGVSIPQLFGKSVVAERYMIDAIATIGYLLEYPSFQTSSIAGVLRRFIPQDTIFLFLSAPYEVIAKRKGVFVDPRSYTDFQNKICLAFARANGALVLDTSEHTLEESHRLIRIFVKEHLRIRQSKSNKVDDEQT